MVARGRGLRHFTRGAVSLAAVPFFLAGLYFAGRAGIAIADRQVPPESVSGSRETGVGGRWHPRGGGGRLMVSDDLQALREHDFQRSTADPAPVAGVREIELPPSGWGIVVLPGSDRRYLRVQLAWEEGGGEEFWLLADELQALAGRVER